MKYYKVEQIIEPDFGCEGRMDGEEVMDSVRLCDAEGNQITISQSDAWLYEQAIEEGDGVELGEDGRLYAFHHKKIAVIGIGGVGGYVGGMLADKYPYVSFVARGDKGKRIRENGLTLHSDAHGEKMVHPYRVAERIQDLEPQDIIFVCVKNYSLEEVCQDLAQCVQEHTVIIPVMNGVDPGVRTAQAVRKGIVIESLIYIISFMKEDGSVVQKGDLIDTYIGIRHADAKQTALVRQIAQLMAQTGMRCKAAQDIEREIWRKYVLNAAYNVETAYYDNCIGQLRDDEKKAAQYEQLIQEAYAVGRAKGVDLRPEDLTHILKNFHAVKYESTSSLQRDFQAKRPTELETFCGYLVREGRQLGIAIPLTEHMYEALKAREAQF